MEQPLEEKPRTYVIKKSINLGYGFIAGCDSPTIVKQVQPDGPSFNRLRKGDIIMAVNGLNVENASLQQIINMILLSTDQIEITVRQSSYEDIIRMKNLQDPRYYTFNKSTNSLAGHDNYRQATLPPPHPSQLNRLVTSIAHQHQQPTPSNPSFALNDDKLPTSSITCTKTVLKPKFNNAAQQDLPNSVDTSSKKNQFNYGRHSPPAQRCKSSIDATKNGGPNKKFGDDDNDQPLLKRSNTMRPIRPPAMGIFEVVTRIFFEVGHTTVLHYNPSTTVKSLLEKLTSKPISNSPHSEQIKSYFGLALTVGIDTEQLSKRKFLHILDENDSIMAIGKLPYAKDLRLLYRMIHPPKDVNALYMQDKVAFEYLYQQSCNDLKLERFFPELDQETTMKLSALHLLEYVHTNHSKAHGNSREPKVYLKLIKKTPGIEYFLTQSLKQSLVDKRGKRIIGQFKKMRSRLLDQMRNNFDEFDFEPPKVRSTTNLNRYSSTSFHELSLPEIKSSPSDYIKLLFLNYLSQMPCYGNFVRPIRKSASPIERISGGECSSSLESVPRTSDSSPLIRQDSNQNNSNANKLEYPTSNNISKLAHINSRRSLSSVQSSINGHNIDQTDLAQTPSIESISSITFNIQNSPSPQQTPIYLSQQSESYNLVAADANLKLEPSPMPRQQVISKSRDYNSIDKLYNQRYSVQGKPIEELLRNVILPPPPPSLMIDDMTYQVKGQMFDNRSTSHFTRVLTDKDIEKLRVPPPPKLLN